jgi:hypothetical protein
MALSPNTPETPQQLARRLLNAGYDSIARDVIAAIDNLPGDVIKRLEELDAEAARLMAAGEQLTPDNPAFKALLFDFDQYMEDNANLIDGVGGDLQIQGAMSGERLAPALSSINPAIMAQIGVGWNRVSVEAMAALVNFVNDPAWAAKIAAFAPNSVDEITKLVINGMRLGWNPLKMAAELRTRIDGLPVAWSNQMMRTLFLQSYRRGTTASYLANSNVLDGRIRIATLDNRVCIGCVALHGTILRLDEEIIEHPHGRCTSIAIIKGRRYNITTGEDWFNHQSPDVQQQMLGPVAWEAWKTGRIKLSDFVTTRQDDLYGEMLQVASLKGILGEEAQIYYRRGK